MESLPYFLVVGLIVGFSVLLFGLNVFGNIYNLTKSQSLNSQLHQMGDKIKLLNSMSYGSFDYIYLTPATRVTIFQNGTIISNDESYSLGIKFNCIRGENSYCVSKLVLYPGKHKLILYHGDEYGSKYCLCFT